MKRDGWSWGDVAAVCLLMVMFGAGTVWFVEIATR